MIDPLAIEKALRERSISYVTSEVRNVLHMLNREVQQDGARPLDHDEMGIVTDALGVVFQAWVADHHTAIFRASIPAGLDEAATVAALKEIIDTRCRAAAGVLTRVLDERLVFEIRIARGTYTLESQARAANQC